MERGGRAVDGDRMPGADPPRRRLLKRWESLALGQHLRSENAYDGVDVGLID